MTSPSIFSVDKTANQIERTAKKVRYELLEKDNLPSVDTLKDMGWSVMPVVDSISIMEAEWLAEAIDQPCAIGLSFEFGCEAKVQLVDCNRDSIIRYIGSNSFQYVCLTSDAVDFLYYKDDRNRFYLLCGNDQFIRSAYKCSRDTARAMYFDYWVDSEVNNQEEKDFLTRIWEKYSIP